jgi:putative addiction module component (TIGR02574 family)
MATAITQTDLFTAALALPQQARAELAERLIESLGKPPGIWSDDDPGFDEELNRRWAAYKTGEIEAIDLDDVIAELEADLDRSPTS